MRCPFLCRILSIGHFSALCKQYLCTILHFCVLHNLRRCILVFFDILQTLCDEKGIAMSALLDSVGMSRGNIARWKNGLVPKSATKIKLANALGVDRSRLDDDQEGKRESSYHAGVDLCTAQKLMGHASIQLTANIYTHLEAADNLQVVSSLNRYFEDIG